MKKDERTIKTKKEALERCFDVWLCAAVNPRLSKGALPVWERNGGWLEECSGDCPCCAYDTEYCKMCPIKWTKHKTKRLCDHPSSPFYKWNSANSIVEKTKYALEICVLAIEGLERL